MISKFDKSKVSKISLVGGPWGDTLKVASNITIPAIFDGGPYNAIETDGLYGGGGNDTFYGDDADMHGGAGNDVFHVTDENIAHGDAGNDTFIVTGEMNEMHGGTGDDKFLMYGYAFNTAYGDAGLDTADFSMHTEDLTIGNASALDARGLGYWSAATCETTSYSSGTYFADDVEIFKGGKGNDQLYGWSGVNQLWGNDGNDLLDGGAGKDALYGGNGNDTFISRDGVQDFLAGGTGTDKAKIDALDVTTGVEISLA